MYTEGQNCGRKWGAEGGNRILGERRNCGKEWRLVGEGIAGENKGLWDQWRILGSNRELEERT